MPLDSLPDIPRGWEDMSWHNDVSPSFRAHTRTDSTYIRVWIDYPDETRRELSGKRFTASWYDAEGNWVGDGFPFAETDDWASLLMAVIGEMLAPARDELNSQTPARPTQSALLAVIEQMTQALGIARTTLETVLELNSGNLAAKNSIRLISSALDAGAALTCRDESAADRNPASNGA